MQDEREKRNVGDGRQLQVRLLSSVGKSQHQAALRRMCRQLQTSVLRRVMQYIGSAPGKFDGHIFGKERSCCYYWILKRLCEKQGYSRLARREGTKVNYEKVIGMLAYLRMVLDVLEGISGRVTLDAQSRCLQSSSVLREATSPGRAYTTKTNLDMSPRWIRRIVFLPGTRDEVTFSGPFSCSRTKLCRR